MPKELAIPFSLYAISLSAPICPSCTYLPPRPPVWEGRVRLRVYLDLAFGCVSRADQQVEVYFVLLTLVRPYLPPPSSCHASALMHLPPLPSCVQSQRVAEVGAAHGGEEVRGLTGGRCAVHADSEARLFSWLHWLRWLRFRAEKQHLRLYIEYRNLSVYSTWPEAPH